MGSTGGRTTTFPTPCPSPNPFPAVAYAPTVPLPTWPKNRFPALFLRSVVGLMPGHSPPHSVMRMPAENAVRTQWLQHVDMMFPFGVFHPCTGALFERRRQHRGETTPTSVNFFNNTPNQERLIYQTIECVQHVTPKVQTSYRLLTFYLLSQKCSPV